MSAQLANLQRRLVDQNLEVSQSLPPAAANNNSPSLDLGSDRLGPASDFVELDVFIGATGSLADGTTITLTVQDSADDTNFAALAGLGSVIRTGAGGAGAGAFTQRFRLPAITRRHLRVNAAVQSGGGNNTASNYGFRVLANH